MRTLAVNWPTTISYNMLNILKLAGVEKWVVDKRERERERERERGGGGEGVSEMPIRSTADYNGCIEISVLSILYNDTHSYTSCQIRMKQILASKHKIPFGSFYGTIIGLTLIIPCLEIARENVTSTTCSQSMPLPLHIHAHHNTATCT